MYHCITMVMIIMINPTNSSLFYRLKLRDVLELEHWDELLTIIIIISFHYFLKMN